MSGKREYGDYQTPPAFADKICNLLKYQRGVLPDTILEPTCGVGNFLKSSLLFDAKEYYGIEINPKYCEICKKEIPDSRLSIWNENFFGFDLKKIPKENLLVIGNPPWVNNSTLSSLSSDNLPLKSNFKGLKGMDALTGASNFDVCEYILLQLIHTYCESSTTVAMLCKTSVARNVFQELKRQSIPFRSCELIEFDAGEVFGIHASACLFLLQLTKEKIFPEHCDLYSIDDLQTVKLRFGYQDGKFFRDLEKAKDGLDGKCCFEWRQGVKHDCSKVMELKFQNGNFVNGKNEIVQIEDKLVFPLVKSSMFKRPILNTFSKYVIVTQKKAREETAHLQEETPMAWAYLNKNLPFFMKRKSSIYRDAPMFSMFGVGDYSYAQYKVGVSGFYKTPLFSILSSKDGKPVMTDDTSYFICFPSYCAAYVAMLYLNSEQVQQFLKNIAFLDSKRPYTKKILSRISFQGLYKENIYSELKRTEEKLGLSGCLTPEMIKDFTFVPEMAKQGLS